MYIRDSFSFYPSYLRACINIATIFVITFNMWKWESAFLEKHQKIIATHMSSNLLNKHEKHFKISGLWQNSKTELCPRLFQCEILWNFGGGNWPQFVVHWNQSTLIKDVRVDLDPDYKIVRFRLGWEKGESSE